MKLTKTQLKKIIKEELLRESDDGGRQGATEGVIESGITYLPRGGKKRAWIEDENYPARKDIYEKEFSYFSELDQLHGEVDLGDIDTSGLEENAQLAYKATVYKIAGAPQ